MNFEDTDEAYFFTTYLSPVEYPIAVQLIAKKQVDVKGLITHRFRLGDFEKPLQAEDNTAEKPIKVLVTKQSAFWFTPQSISLQPNGLARFPHIRNKERH